MLYLHRTNTRLALKLFRGEPAISGFDWNFSPIHTSSPPFSTTWIDHPVSGLPLLTFAQLKLGFPSAPSLKDLTSPAAATRRTVLQKVRGCILMILPQLVNTGFQGLFHSPPGVLFTFPSQYYALSVRSPPVPTRFHVSRGTLDPAVLAQFSLTGLSPSLAGLSRTVLLTSLVTYAVRTPECSHSGLGSFPFARRYSGNHYCFLFLRLLRCFSSPGSPCTPIRLALIQCTVTEGCSAGFPHSDICGSCSSPQLFAAYHVFHRLLVPRHPPCALFSLTC